MFFFLLKKEIFLFFIKKQKNPWDEFTFASAAKNASIAGPNKVLGNLDNMKWLLENGCPWDEETFEEAAKHKNPEVLKWVETNLKN